MDAEVIAALHGGLAMNVQGASRATGLPAKTIRYYEDIGLVSPARQANGYRHFSENDLHKLTFLARSRSLGFSIEDCRQLLSLYDDADRSSRDVRALAVQHIADVDRKLGELKEIRKVLSGLVEACEGDHRPDCPIMDSLSGEA
ncbi:Cu(I)-responsive transcriptional regulator [Hyphobacterium sp. HN65]|uniref:Cu(I)-responsive transcriptional regulator n=2 Tax=Hyphobacterium lacteum TaxID=3116575 RepID=A0ABU7LNS7_9PROT|nr:Cu(I)-responsive transcriptional regulator [Hyphobacterium sp. HN65]MEE2525547.1 Cu(I)-responsive transcriptional regulator [Hyphobacterium sp. HN65]